MAPRFFRDFNVRSASAGLFAPRKPRGALARVAIGVLGVALLAVMLVVGVIVGGAMLTGGLVLRLFKSRAPASKTRERVVEGQYHRVEPRSGQPLLR